MEENQRTLTSKRQSTLHYSRALHCETRENQRNPEIPKFPHSSPALATSTLKCRLQSEAPGRFPTLTRVNTIPPGDAEQEVYTARHLKLPRNQTNSQTSRVSPGFASLPQFLARYSFSCILEMLLESLDLARGTYAPTSAGGLRRRCRFLVAWLKSVGGPLGSALESHASS